MREEHTLELKKFKKKKNINMNVGLEQWLSFMLMTEKGEVDMDVIKNYDIRIQQVCEELKNMALDPVKRMLYEQEVKELSDNKNRLRHAGESGEETGRKKVAKSLLKLKVDKKIIMVSTGLTDKEIEELEK